MKITVGGNGFVIEMNFSDFVRCFCKNGRAGKKQCEVCNGLGFVKREVSNEPNALQCGDSPTLQEEPNKKEDNEAS